MINALTGVVSLRRSMGCFLILLCLMNRHVNADTVQLVCERAVPDKPLEFTIDTASKRAWIGQRPLDDVAISERAFAILIHAPESNFDSVMVISRKTGKGVLVNNLGVNRIEMTCQKGVSKF